MATEIINTCDKCKKVIPEGDDIWTIGVTYQCRPAVIRHVNPIVNNKKLSMDMCRECLEDYHLLPTRVDRKIPKEPPTLDELLREIIQAEVQLFYENM